MRYAAIMKTPMSLRNHKHLVEGHWYLHSHEKARNIFQNKAVCLTSRRPVRSNRREAGSRCRDPGPSPRPHCNCQQQTGLSIFWLQPYIFGYENKYLIESKYRPGCLQTASNLLESPILCPSSSVRHQILQPLHFSNSRVVLADQSVKI